MKKTMTPAKAHKHCCTKPQNATTSITQLAVTEYTANGCAAPGNRHSQAQYTNGNGCVIRTNPTSRDSQRDTDTIIP